MGAPDQNAELVRIRDRVHTLFGRQNAILLRVHALEEWRTDHQREADEAFDQLKDLVREDATARAVALALKRRNRLELTWAQRVLGAVLVIPAFVDVAHLLKLI